MGGADTIYDPYTHYALQAARNASTVLAELGINASPDELLQLIAEPPDPRLGDLGLPLFRYARVAGKRPDELARLVAEKHGRRGSLAAEAAGGYVNFRIDTVDLAETVLKLAGRPGYGYNPAEKPLRIVVEHTSANPIHPLHIGHARNTALGDALARILSNRGHWVQTRYYVDDTGRQVAVLAYGYRLLGEPEPPGDAKPDEWLGHIYALTNLLIELRGVRARVAEIEERARRGGEEEAEEYRRLVERQDRLAADIGRLWPRVGKDVFDRLAEAIMGSPRDPEEEIKRIMAAYERGEDWAKRLVGRVVELALKGIRMTLDKLGVRFDKWDYESMLVWSGLVDKVIAEARRSPYYTIYKGAEAIDTSRLARDKEIRRRLGITLGGDIPPLILRRSDGTTLYTTKDIAYTIYKFRDASADKVINVIGGEQRLPQAQVKLALYALGYRREAENLVTYIYEMVTVPGHKMSSRRGRIITLDWLLDQLYARAREEVEERRPDLSEREKDAIAWSMAKAALRYQMVSVAPLRPISFSFEKALSLKENSAPYLLYTYVRARSVLRKAGETPVLRTDKIPDPERRLIWLIAKYPRAAAEAADDLAPEKLANHLVLIADAYNEFYDKYPILREPDESLRSLRLHITLAVSNVVRHGLGLLGIQVVEKI